MEKLIIKEIDVILNRAKEYLKNDWKNIIRAHKNIKREYGRNRYHNMSKEVTQKLKEYQKNYHETKNSKFSDQ